MTDQPTEPPDHQANRPRGGNGRYTRSPDTAERDAQAAELRGRGWSFRRIATELGYASHSSAHDAVQRALDAIPQEAGEAARRLELERLNQMYVDARTVLEREHLTVSHGKVVRVRVLDDDGNPVITDYDTDGRPIYREKELIDDGPVLHAIDRLLKISERRSKLLGLDAPVKLSAEAQGLGSEIAQLIADLSHGNGDGGE